MKVLVLGGGGREHALTWALSRSPLVKELHCAPGNPGIGEIAELHPVDPTNLAKIVELAQELGIDLAVVGPEAPLVAGVSDALREAGVAVFGPGRSGARLEGSKAFAKSFMARANIPTAPFDICRTMDEARAALRRRSAPYVVKADGLAAGKGAFVLDLFEEAEEVCSELLEHDALGEAGHTLVVEDYLPGWEITILALSDGESYRILPASQDHKRAYDGDTGPNTGGMGAYTPVPRANAALLKKIEECVVAPTVEELRREGIPFRGVLYCGIMVVNGEPIVLEYNTRFGDPETQVVLPSLDVDWGEVLAACASGKLSSVSMPRQSRAVAGVVLASGGYPGDFDKGYAIKGLPNVTETSQAGDKSQEGILLFHAGTKTNSYGDVVTAGGRVLTAVGMGETLDTAVARAYECTRRVFFEKMHFRRDIARKALENLPRVGIVLGSASDVPLAQEAAEALKSFGVPFEVTIASAHRTPMDAAHYAINAASRGLRVLLAAAGLSAALPGVLAAHTTLPVLGIPVPAGTLGGLDALLAIAQMPPGVPVGASGIGGARNAALLAVRILALSDAALAEKLDGARGKAAEGVAASRAKLGDLPQPPQDAFRS